MECRGAPPVRGVPRHDAWYADMASEPIVDRRLDLRDRLLMEAVAVIYMMLAAQCHGRHYLLFPGLAALSYDVLTRPWGKWASQPGRLIATPVLAAAFGTLVTRLLPFGVPAILLVVSACLLLLLLTKSNIAPAVAAGVLPLFLGITSWVYAASVAISLVALTLILLPWQRRCRRKYHHGADGSTTSIDDILETAPTGSAWVLPYFAFVTAMALGATVLTTSGWRLLLFPPLIVIAYEMFAHPTTCPWAGKPLALPAACALTATAGWAAVRLCGSGAIAAASAMVAGVIVLRLFNLRLPPALAVGLLPLVIKSPGVQYPISVAVGAGALTLAFGMYQRWVIGPGRIGPDVPTTLRSV